MYIFVGFALADSAAGRTLFSCFSVFSFVSTFSLLVSLVLLALAFDFKARSVSSIERKIALATTFLSDVSAFEITLADGKRLYTVSLICDLVDTLILCLEKD